MHLPGSTVVDFSLSGRCHLVPHSCKACCRTSIVDAGRREGGREQRLPHITEPHLSARFPSRSGCHNPVWSSSCGLIGLGLDGLVASLAVEAPSGVAVIVALPGSLVRELLLGQVFYIVRRCSFFELLFCPSNKYIYWIVPYSSLSLATLQSFM